MEHVKNEIQILAQVEHPFIVNLMGYLQDRTRLYMLMEYVPGGELFTHLRSEGRFSNDAAKFYAAEIAMAFDYLHKRSVVYRDLKPENLLITKHGHLKITDFGFAKIVRDRTYTLCGTPEYLAPEIIKSKGHDKAVDWWALGILIYEMLAGYPPFNDDESTFQIYKKILEGVIEFPRRFDPKAKDIVRKLLSQDRSRRLGCMAGAGADVMNHRWFGRLNWDAVFSCSIPPPFVPEIRGENDTRNFPEEYPDSDEGRPEELTSSQARLFDDLDDF